jgi:hypothetical protein
VYLTNRRPAQGHHGAINACLVEEQFRLKGGSKSSVAITAVSGSEIKAFYTFVKVFFPHNVDNYFKLLIINGIYFA